MIKIFVIVFPEGTRQPYGKLGEYQKGGISIAKNTGCEILPVYHNAGRALNFSPRLIIIGFNIANAQPNTGMSSNSRLSTQV
jgi:1-acyl-sn-glycerol-3-phosphate acyltransferase